MPAPAAGTPQLARTRERRHRTARVRTSTGGCARRSPGTTPRDGSSSLPTSTNRSRSLTCSFAFSKHRLSGLGPCWVRDGVRVGLLEPVGEALELVREQVSVAVQRHRRRGMAELGLDRVDAGAPDDEQAHAGMAKVMEPQPVGESRPGQRRLEDAGDEPLLLRSDGGVAPASAPTRPSWLPSPDHPATGTSSWPAYADPALPAANNRSGRSSPRPPFAADQGGCAMTPLPAPSATACQRGKVGACGGRPRARQPHEAPGNRPHRTVEPVPPAQG